MDDEIFLFFLKMSGIPRYVVQYWHLDFALTEENWICRNVRLGNFFDGN